MSRKISKRSTKRVDAKKSLWEMEFPTYEEVMEEIRNKVGRMPKLPKGFSRGNWTEQSLKVLEERYLQKDPEGKVIETPEEMVWRVSWDIASAEARWGATRAQVNKQAEVFYHLLSSREFLPNSPTLMNAGTGNMLQYSACFVLPVGDSMEEIFDALKYQAIIHKTGGGTGFSFSRLRPSGARVRTSQGVASGPVSFMRIFDAATNEVKQGGKRRGANMGILRVDHPDIMEFIHCKEDGGITNFNISVAATDKFMEAYEKDEDYELIDPHTKEIVGKLSARRVFDEICEAAWKTGDPGLIFIDRRNRGSSNPVPELGPIESTNPCGEQELYPYDACNLGSIFLTYFVKNKNGKREVDWDKLESVTRIAVRFLDDVIEVNPFPIKQIRQTVLGIRRIGLGVGGWADMLADLEIPYDSEEAVTLGKKVMRFIQETAVDEDRLLAKQRGPFPLFDRSIYKNEEPRRNSTVTTIAPTGSISIIAGSSSGIEPFFAIAYRHIVKDKYLSRNLSFVNPYFENIAKARGFNSPELMEKVLEHGTVREIEEIPEDVRRIFGTAHDIDPDWHIKMQAAFQEYTENAVSKTINLDHDSTVEDIKKAYLLAWETDCKGITVFRDGSKDAQVLNLGTKEAPKPEETKSMPALIERPFRVVGATYKMSTPVGSAFITINEDENGNPLEVFINSGKAGSEVTAMAQALGRTISTSLRFNAHIPAKEKARQIMEQLSGIGGRRSVGFGAQRVLSLPDAVAVAIATHYGFKTNGLGHSAVNGGSYANGEAHAHVEPKTASNANGQEHTAGSSQTLQMSQSELVVTQEVLEVSGDICPSCGASSFVYEEGCSKCYSCGYSEC